MWNTVVQSPFKMVLFPSCDNTFSKGQKVRERGRTFHTDLLKVLSHLSPYSQEEATGRLHA
jgi:hypothetical protein